MKILVIGHSYVVDSNRQFWNELAKTTSAEIDLIVPRKWKSNLINELAYSRNESTDAFISNVVPLDVYNSGNGSFYHFHWRNLFSVLRKKKYDVIFIFQETWAFSLAQVILLKCITQNINTPIQLAVCQNIIKPYLAFLIPWERFLCFFVQRIWFCTYEILNVLRFKKISCPNSYLPFTFDQSVYDFKLKQIGDVVRIGFMGRLTEEKGIEDLYNAIKILHNEGIKIELHLAGAGNLEKTINGNFIIKHGILPHRRAHEFYHLIDIFVLPSRTKKFWKEQFGRVIVESTASGTPVVGSSSGAIPEVIKSLGYGEVFEEQNVTNLAFKIKEQIRKMQLAEYPKLIEEASKRTVVFASHKEVARKTFNVIQEDVKKQLS